MSGALQDRGLADVSEAFGFSIGEERRYAVSPDDVLEPGEIESWMARLVGIETEPDGGYTAYFLLQHESKRFARSGNIFNPDEMFRAVTTTRLWVNEYGFPLRIDHSFEHSNYAVSDERIRVLFQEDRFVVTNDAPMSYGRLELRVPEGDHVDLSVPRGVFLGIEWHPALLTLPYAVLSDGRREVIEYVSFTPSSTALRRPRPRGGGPFRFATISVGNRGRTTLGGATTPGDRVRVNGEDDWWVGEKSTVLWAASGGRWVRLLRPSEY